MKLVSITVFPSQDTIHAKDTGVGSYAYLLFQEVKKIPEISTIEIWAQKGPLLGEYAIDNISIKRVWNRGIGGVFALVKKIITNRPKVIHLQHEFNLFGGIFAAIFSPLIVISSRLLGVKIITTMHGGFGLSHIDKQFVLENGSSLPPLCIKIGFRSIFGIFAAMSHHVIVHESWQRDDLIKQYNISPKKITVIPHGVSDQVDHVLNAREQLSIPKHKKVFLYMGFASAYKGLDQMYEVYKEFLLKKENQDSLLIIGAGKSPRMEGEYDYEQWYTKLKEKYVSLGKFVRFVGFIPSQDIARYYSASDAVVFPYIRRLAASGPMAIAIGYEKNLILSSVLKGEEVYSFSFNDTQETISFKKGRTWDKIASSTFLIYIKYYENFTSSK